MAERWMNAGIWETRQEGDRRVCAACGAGVRSYTYRFYPPESDMYERCVGFAWCSVCRIYGGSMVHVPRREVLPDLLGDLPAEEVIRLKKSESRLIAYLDGRVSDDPGGRGRH